MDPLASDLTLFVGEPETCAGLFRILQRVPGASAPGWEQGVLRCRVEAVLHGSALAGGPSAQVRYARMVDVEARARASLNYWNRLELNEQDLLVLVCKPAAGNAPWQALAGNQVESADSPIVAGLRECYRIEGLIPASEAQRLALQ